MYKFMFVHKTKYFFVVVLKVFENNTLLNKLLLHHKFPAMYTQNLHAEQFFKHPVYFFIRIAFLTRIGYLVTPGTCSSSSAIQLLDNLYI